MKRQLKGVVIAALLLLNILLTAFMILPARATAQVPTWSRPRPTDYRDFTTDPTNSTVENANSSDNGIVSIGVTPAQYIPHTQGSGGVPYDVLNFRLSAFATTRNEIDYQYESAYRYSWIDDTNHYDTGISGDDSGKWVDLGFPFVYYGVMYSRMWVSSNGFVSLSSEGDLGTPCSLPNSGLKNAIIAPFWTRLRMSAGGGSIKYGYDNWTPSNSNDYFFVVTWDNIADVNGHRQTFQLLIQVRENETEPYNNMIFFQYNSIATSNTQFTVGLQDRLGFKGYETTDTAKVCNGGYLGIYPPGLGVYPLDVGTRLVSLGVDMSKSDSHARVVPESEELIGSNVQLNATDTQNPNGALFTQSLEIGAQIMLTVMDVPVIGNLFMFYDLGMAYVSDHMANAQAQTIVISEFNDPENASVRALCENTTGTDGQAYVQGAPFDASLSDLISWDFNDIASPQDHTLTVTVTAVYADYYQDGTVKSFGSVATQVVLNMYTGYHYLDIGSAIELPQGEQDISGVNVWIDGQPYSTPILWLIVNEGNHTIQADPLISRIDGAWYRFLVWTDGGFDSSKTELIDRDNVTNALYKQVFTLRILASSGGTTSPTPKSYYYDYDTNENVTVTATAASNYCFWHWMLDGQFYPNSSIVVEMNTDHTMTACFLPAENLTINSNTGGTTSPPAGAYTYGYGTQVSVTATASSGSGYTFVCWFLDDTLKYDNPILVQMNANHTLTPDYIQNGGCPYVYAWNGTGYAKDNNILPASETGNGTDTKDYCLLQQPLVPVFSTRQASLYSLQIREFENEQDYIDQVKLIAVDHSQGTSIAVTPEGQILTYTSPAAPISCIDNNGVSQLSEIGRMDGNVSDPSTYFQGNKGDWLVLDFGKITGPAANLILRDDMLCEKDTCINVQVPDANGVWQTVEALLHPRAFWSIEAVNMTAYVPKTGDFQIRLLWTASHRLDYVGLDTSSQGQTIVNSAPPVLAIHSTLGDVTKKLLYDDENCVKLVNGQQITLAFTLPNKAQGTTRDFIFYVDGYYYTITP